MRQVTLAIIGTLCLTGAALADPVVGTWKTQADDNGHYGHVSVSKCGNSICGVIGKAYDRAGNELDSKNVGKRMIWNMNSDGDGTYSGGKIWAPDRDKTYNSVMELNGNSLKVKGCVFGICRGQTWTRIK